MSFKALSTVYSRDSTYACIISRHDSATESAPAPDIIFGANADVIDVDF